MKTAREEFDLGDFVNDIHGRLKNGKYGGDQMDFVYIDEVQDLTQSVIDILYCYFVHSIENLEPETSLISGEAPVLLESGNDENAIVTIFGGNESSGEVVGFGAEQVILVRDERAKTEICEYVGRQALVLTILECKGLEFHDVLLYNCFGTSPLKDQWRVIYGYMKKYDWLDEKLPQSFPTFTEFFHENNFVMATMCFERAGDTMWEKLAKASGLRASADQMRESNYEAFKSYVREAAGIFESVGKIESAASCCYSDAAEAYAKGDMFSNCLSACIKGKLFDKGMQAFCSMKSKRVFLRSLGRLDDLLSLEEESGHFMQAAELARSLGDVLKEADLFAKAGYSVLDSDKFYDFVCNDLNVLSDQRSSLTELKKDLDASRKYKSLRGEILSTRKILDAHFRLSSSKYEWEDKLPVDINKQCKEMMFQNMVSVRTLLVFKDAHWIRNTSRKGLRRDGECLTMDVPDLVSAMRSYWDSELLSVGMKVVETLEGLYQLKSNGSTFHQGISLLHIYDVSNFLFSCKYLDLTPPFNNIVHSSLKKSRDDYFELMFPFDWRKSGSEDLISLRTIDLSVNLLNEAVLGIVVAISDLDYSSIVRVMTTCLGFRTLVAVYEILIKKLESKPMWKLFIGKLWDVGFKEDLVLPEYSCLL
ncbi:UvrD-like helicase, ATP-binding domain, P-loop containing nucleoside triphosphate hydrolase [Tanacetum coccineum]